MLNLIRQVHSTPVEVITDNGSAFTSNATQSFVPRQASPSNMLVYTIRCPMDGWSLGINSKEDIEIYDGRLLHQMAPGLSQCSHGL